MSDLISRQAAIEAEKEMCKHYTPRKSTYHPHIDFVIEELQKLPSVEPERKLGHWEDCSNGWMCSECKHDVTYTTKHCPNCGAKMEV